MHSAERELIVCLPCYRTYEAPYKTFALAAEHGYRVRMALLHGPHPPLEEFPDIEQINVPEHLNILTRRRFWKQWFETLPWDCPTILQDTFLAQMGFYKHRRAFLGKSRSVDIRNVLYLVSPTPGFLFQGHWKRPRSVPLSVQEILYAWRLQFPCMVMEWLSCRFMDGVIGNTSQIAIEAAKYYGVPETRCRWLPDAADPFFTPGERNRKALGLRDDEVILLYVGNFLRRKGIDILIQAVDVLRRMLPNVRLVMVGGGNKSDRAWYDQFIVDAELRSKITLVGWVDREVLREYYRAADVFLYPTRHEGSPRVVKDALGAGCPVVCSDVPGIRIIDPDGQSVIFSNENAPEAYIEPVLRLLKDVEYRRNRVAAGFDIVRSLMPEKIVMQLLSFYDQLLSIPLEELSRG